MLRKMLKLKTSFDFEYFKRVTLRTYLYSCYLSLKYVDDYAVFPAIQFSQDRFPIRIRKFKGAVIDVRNRLVFEQWLNKKSETNIVLEANSYLIFENTTILGNNISLLVSNGARLEFGGKKVQSASGITADSCILVKKYVRIGVDNIIAWDTFITDCDWHSYGENKPQKNTIIGHSCWLGVGVKVLKGAVIGDESIVTTNSTVLSNIYQANSMLSGSPAKIIKTNIPKWNREMKFSKNNIDNG